MSIRGAGLRTLAACAATVFAAAACSQTSGGQAERPITDPLCGEGPAALSPGGTSASIPISILGEPVPISPTVMVGIGTGAPVRMILDTGSVGLRVFASALGSPEANGITVTSTQVAETFASGSVFNGRCSTAIIHLGDATATAAEVPFQLVDSVSCASFRPNCEKLETANGTAGILGIGLSPMGIPNPLEYLPGSQAGAWSIHLSGNTGELTAGAVEPSGAKATFNLPRQGSEGSVPAWDDHAASVCWAVGTTAPTCAPTAFDTGAVAINWWDPSLAQAAGVAPSAAGTRIPPGHPVALASSASAQPFWNLVSGIQPAGDLIFAQTDPFPQAGNALASTGVAVFFAFTVSCDVLKGTIALS